MADLIGKIISGRYRVDAFLGKGGMAEVYKVWDQVRSVDLAMKVLSADLAEDKVFVRRFKREALTLSQLQHPNIVRFYEMQQDGDLTYILMDFVEGTTLRREIFHSKGPLSPHKILTVMRPVCAALNYSHCSHIVHCDIKPANIMIHTNGTVLVSDFGISRMTEAATATMVGAGTPAYMAPEQARGEDPVPQTDIYALGIVLYEMLSGGERPFTGEHARTTGSTGEKIRWEQLYLQPPSLRALNNAISADLEGVVFKCLEKDPHQRYQTVQELLLALEQNLNDQASAEPAAQPQASAVPAPAQAQAAAEAPEAALPVPSTPRRVRPYSYVYWASGLLILIALAIVGYSIFSGGGFSSLGTEKLMETRTANAIAAAWTEIPSLGPTPDYTGHLGINGARLYSGPAEFYDHFFTYYDEVTILGQAHNCAWFKVTTNSSPADVGWIGADKFTYSVDCSDVKALEILPTPFPSPTFTRRPPTKVPSSGGNAPNVNSCQVNSNIHITNRSGYPITLLLTGPGKFTFYLAADEYSTVLVCSGTYNYSIYGNCSGTSTTHTGKISDGDQLNFSCSD
jgi:hypothetical protein